MAWGIEFERPALREFEKLSYPERARILAFLTRGHDVAARGVLATGHMRNRKQRGER
jgi:hypothetical protein